MSGKAVIQEICHAFIYRVVVESQYWCPWFLQEDNSITFIILLISIQRRPNGRVSSSSVYGREVLLVMPVMPRERYVFTLINCVTSACLQLSEMSISLREDGSFLCDTVHLFLLESACVRAREKERARGRGASATREGKPSQYYRFLVSSKYYVDSCTSSFSLKYQSYERIKYGCQVVLLQHGNTNAIPQQVDQFR